MTGAVVLAVIPSSSSDGTYDIVQEPNGKLWCRITGTSNACMAWSRGWKSTGYHTCKHVREAISRLHLQTVPRDTDLHVVSPGTSAAVARTAAGTTWAPSREAPTPSPARVATPVNRAPRPVVPPVATSRIPSLDEVRASLDGGLERTIKAKPAKPALFDRSMVMQRKRRRPDE